MTWYWWVIFGVAWILAGFMATWFYKPNKPTKEETPNWWIGWIVLSVGGFATAISHFCFWLNDKKEQKDLQSKNCI